MSRERENKKALINRGNLRDMIILLSSVSAFIFYISWWKMAISFLLLIVGCSIHFITKGALIRNTVLCKDGIYQIIRHPYYLANYVIDSSFCLISGNPYLILIYPFLFFWAYGPTLRREERLLASIYGDMFFKYSLDIPQVFPDAYSIKSWRDFFLGFTRDHITSKELTRIIRFWSFEFLIMFFHDLRTEGLNELNFLSRPNDYDGLIFLSLIVILYTINFIVYTRSRGSYKRE